MAPNQIDLGAAKTLGIPVFNAPYSNTFRSVAELVVAEAILLMRGDSAEEHAMPSQRLVKSAAGSFEVRDKVLG